jgi:pimeloyl-ACP methyl ester carboxylesterase
VIGHSLGGAVALAAAVQRPDLVRGLILEDPAPLGDGEEQRAPGKGREIADNVRACLEAQDHAELTEVRRAAHPTWRDDELLAGGLAAQQTDLEFLARGEWKPSARWPGLFAELILPALVVSGDDPDEVCVDAEMEKALAEVGNPNLTLVRVKGAGHCVRREQPDRFYEAVHDWLTRH